MNDNRNEDFEFIVQSITMQQVAENYGFQVNQNGFIRCPFHANGSERTPSFKIYPGKRGFHCKSCGVGGDVIKFVELLNNLTPLEAMMELATTFHITISCDVDMPSEIIERAKQARYEQQKAITLEQQKQAELRQLGTIIQSYKKIIEQSKPFSDIWCHYQNKLPILVGEWERLFDSIKRS